MKSKQPEVLKRWSGGAVAIVPGKFSNVYLLASPSAIVMVDAGLPSDTVSALEFVRSQPEFQSVSIKLIVLTHLHLDHAAGVSLAATRTGASIAIGQWAKPYLDGQRIPMPPLRQWLCELIPMWFKQDLPFPSLFDLRNSCITGFPFTKNHLQPPASIWLQPGENLPYLSDWKILHLPGHTADSLCLFNERLRLLIAGDLILNYFGTGEFTNIVSDETAKERSVSVIRRLDLTGILPGHGHPFWGNDLAAGISQRSQCGICNTGRVLLR